ncbi:MAG: hypothetical protein IJ770_02740 [Alphaproteobacteria bacterium]|nr:hypothetical protein [Alphaproteobacteria bacterium]
MSEQKSKIISSGACEHVELSPIGRKRIMDDKFQPMEADKLPPLVPLEGKPKEFGGNFICSSTNDFGDKIVKKFMSERYSK